MSNQNPGILHHISLGTNHYDKAVAFYDKVLAPLGCKVVMQFPGATAYGQGQQPQFWIQAPIDGQKAGAGNGTHICFAAKNKDEVDAFHANAISMGAQDDGKPGPRPLYHERYYGAFVRDLDGHKIEAMCWI